MKLRLLITFPILLALLLAPLSSAYAQEGGWAPVVPGIDYQHFVTEGPVHVYVARMHRDEPTVTIESAIARGRLNGGLEKVSNMALRYEGAINYWGKQWGNTNDVVVAINGSFYDWRTALPDRGMFHSGWYAKRFTNLVNGSGFFWTLNRGAFIGECVTHLNSLADPRQFVTYDPDGAAVVQLFNDINPPQRAEDTLALYTPQWNIITPEQQDEGIEVVVELTRPLLTLPRNSTGSSVRGTVVQINFNHGGTLIPFDHIVLSAHGVAADILQANVHVGMTLGVNQEIRNLAWDDCSTVIRPNVLDWTNAYAAVGGSYYFLKDGQFQQTYNPNDQGATTRQPRTAIAFNDQYVYYLVADGRQDYSIGLTIPQLAAFVANTSTLSATYAINQDGGGSSTMWINGDVVNVPSDPCFSVFLPALQTDNPGFRPLPPLDPQLQLAAPPELRCERWVANAMMMVVVQPITQTTTFTPSLLVSTQAETYIRTGPGTNYGAIALLPSGANGSVINHSNGLNGVYATGSNWWKVSVQGIDGWVDEHALAQLLDLKAQTKLYNPR